MGDFWRTPSYLAAYSTTPDPVEPVNPFGPRVTEAREELGNLIPSAVERFGNILGSFPDVQSTMRDSGFKGLLSESLGPSWEMLKLGGSLLNTPQTVVSRFLGGDILDTFEPSGPLSGLYEGLQNFWSGTGMKQGVVSENDLSADARLKARFAVQELDQADQAKAELEANLAQLRAARDQAIRSAGGAAAKPYDDAIAKVLAEIQRLEVAKQQSYDLFKGIMDRTTQWYDAAIAVADYSDEGIQSIAVFQGQRALERGEFIDGINESTSRLIANAGVSGPGAEVAMAGMRAIEERVYEEDTRSFDAQRRLMEAGAQVALATAQYGRAKNRADLGRQHSVIHMQIVEKIDEMLQNKADLEAKRAAAVSRARSQAAAAWPSNIPKSGVEYGRLLGWQYLQGAASGSDELYDLENFWDSFGGASGLQTRSRIKAAIVAWMQNEGQTPTAAQLESWSDKIFTAQRVYFDGVNTFDNEWSGADPSTLPPDSLARAIALVTQVSRNPLMSEKDIQNYATDPANHSATRSTSNTPIYVPLDTERSGR